MEHCIKIGKFGLPAPKRISSVKENDRIVCYVSKESKVVALGMVTRGYYQAQTKVFRALGEYPHRFDFRTTSLDPELDFRTVRDQLILTKGQQNWAGVLRLNIAMLPEEDWQLFEKVAGLPD